MSSLITRLRHSNTPPSGSPPPSSLSSLDTASTSSTTTSSSSSDDNAGKLPFPKTLPDLRFEQSFLASCRGFIHEVDDETAREEKNEGLQREMREKRAEREALDEKEEEERRDDPPKVLQTRSPKGEPELWLGSLRIEWLSLLHLTVRDQLFSPFIQGTVWGVGGMLLANVRAYTAARRAQGKTVIDFGALLGSVGLTRSATPGSVRGR